MAKYEVKMSCGHTETVNLFGAMKDRDRKIAWLGEHGICTACYKARRDAAHATATAEAAAKATEENLPALTGSEKQINWALTIRANKLAGLAKMVEAGNAKIADQAQRDKNQMACQAARNVLVAKTEAKFWIDNRDVDAKRLIAANNLQDELKAEFAKLTAAASDDDDNNNNGGNNDNNNEPDTDDYAVNPDALDVAVGAEIELANAEASEAEEKHQEELKMKTIETKIAKNGAKMYYVDGKRVSRKVAEEIESKQAIERRNNLVENTFAEYEKKSSALVVTAGYQANIVICFDGYIDFTYTRNYSTCEDAINAVNFFKTNFCHGSDGKFETGNVTREVEAECNGIAYSHCLHYYMINAADSEGQFLKDFESPTEANPDDYAISQEAMDVAVDAETELANSKVQTSTPVIDIAEYNTMMTWAEKISNGQRDAVTPIVTYLSKFGYIVDKQDVFNAIDTDDLNGFRRYISQFHFLVKDDAGYIQKLYAQEDGQVVLVEIPTSEYPNTENNAPEFKYYIKSRRPIAGAVPKGYISATAGEMKAYSFCTDGSVSRVPRKVVFGVVVYDHPLSDEQIINYDLHVDPHNPNPIIKGSENDKEGTQMTIEIPAEGKHEFTIGDDNDVEIDETSPANTLVADIEEDDVEELNPIVETKITKRSLDSVSLKLNGKRISLRNLEDALDAPRTNFAVINEYGKKYDCRRCSKDYYGFFGTSPEEYTIHFNTLGELVKHYAFDNIVRDTASETPVDSTLTADIAKYQDVFDSFCNVLFSDNERILVINDESLIFNNANNLTAIISDRYHAEITFNNGRKRFRYRGMITKRADFLDAMSNEIVAAEQKEIFGKFYDDYQMPDTELGPNADYFQIRIFPKFANGTESSFHATANNFPRALELIELFKSLNLPFIGLIKRNTVCGEEYYRHNRDGSETINPPEPPKPADKEPYRPFTPKEEVDIIKHNINWAKDTLATMTGDTYTDNIGETFTCNQLKQFIADWQDEIADLQPQAGKTAEPPKPVELVAPTVMSALETINAMFPLDGFIEDVSKPNFRSAVNGDWRLNIFIGKNGTPEAVSLAEDDQLFLTVKIKARSLRDSINRAIKTCVKNRIAYRKNHNAEMEKYEYELMHLLQAARRELEVA